MWRRCPPHMLECIRNPNPNPGNCRDGALMFAARCTDRREIGAEPGDIMKTFVAAFSLTSALLFYLIFLV
jgi:hypothetical protein